MKKNYRKVLNMIILSFFFFFCPLIAKAEGMATTGFKMNGKPYLGETFDVILYINDVSGTTDDAGLAAFGGHFYYDNEKLELVSYESLAPFDVQVVGNNVGGFGRRYINGYQDILKFTFRALKTGNVIIDYPDNDQPDSKANPVYITGSKLNLEIIDPLTIDEISIFVLTGQSKKLTVSYNLEDPVTGTWTSLNPSIATVDSNGNVTGVSPGKTKIVYQTSNGYRVECEVTISNYLKGDVNRDGTVNIKDAMEIMYIVTKRKPLTSDVQIIGDMNEDQSINVKDAMEIMYIVTKRKPSI